MLRSTQEFIAAVPHCASRAFRSLAVQVFFDFGWILGSLMGPHLDAFSSIWVNWGIKTVSRTFDLFRRGLGMRWKLQKYGFT